MNFKSLIIILFIPLAFSACTSQKKLRAENELQTKVIMNSWMGQSKARLIRAWGPPTRYNSDGQGGQILIYEKSKVMGAFVGPGYVQRIFTDYVQMFAHQDGTLYYWRTGTN